MKHILISVSPSFIFKRNSFDIMSARLSKDAFRENTYISEFHKHDMRKNHIGIEPEFDSFSKVAQQRVKTKNWTLGNVFKTTREECFCELDIHN